MPTMPKEGMVIEVAIMSDEMRLVEVTMRPAVKDIVVVVDHRATVEEEVAEEELPILDIIAKKTGSHCHKNNVQKPWMQMAQKEIKV